MTTTRKHWAIFWLAWAVWIIASVAVSRAADVSLEWDANTDPGLSGYKLHYGVASGDYTKTTDVKNVTSFTVTGLTPGVTYYIVATAYNSDGLESTFSNEVIYTVPVPPAAPKNLRRRVVQQPQIFPKQP